jgi:hypothetical protein
MNSKVIQFTDYTYILWHSIQETGKENAERPDRILLDDDKPSTY